MYYTQFFRKSLCHTSLVTLHFFHAATPIEKDFSTINNKCRGLTVGLFPIKC